MNNKSLILTTLALALAVFAAAAWYATRPAPFTGGPPVIAQADRLIRPYSPVMGPDEASVTIVEFFDPACEACRAFHPIVKDIMAQYPDDVRVVLRYTPFHGDPSEIAIKVLEAARLQGVFMPVLEALLQRQNLWASHNAPAAERIMMIADSVGLDADAAQSQIKMPDVIAVLNQDKADVEAVGVRQTPTFFVNGRPLEPFGEAALRALVKAEVERAGKP